MTLVLSGGKCTTMITGQGNWGGSDGTFWIITVILVLVGLATLKLR